MKRIIAFAAALFLLPMLLQTADSAELSDSAVSAIVTDADSGRVLYEKNADERCLIASTTKIMTGYLACRYADPEQVLDVPAEAVGVEGSSVYLQPGERVSVRMLLYGTMLQSGNDAATALAAAVSGDVGSFVALMNDTAQQLGMHRTHYANPHGLDSEENYSTARDLATLTAAALQEPLFAQVVACKSASFGKRSFVNHNKLLWRCEGAIGVKTGYTTAAGRILVSAVRRGGRTLIAVTLNDRDDWNDHMRLYDSLFSSAKETAAAVSGQPIMTVRLAAEGKRQVELLAAEDVQCLLFPGETLSFRFYPYAIPFAPTEYGESAGVAAICADGREVARVPVAWGATVLR